MTARVLTPQQVPQLVPTLLGNQAVIGLIPATADSTWAAQVTWAIARAAAGSGRQVLLVDLSREGASLDDGATLPGTQGIGDAFLADTPLEEVAVAQSPSGLHYIGRGPGARPTADVWASERWRRLARGFASEGALLLLYAPPLALATLPLDDLAIIVLSPEGYHPSSGAFPRIGERLDAGAPLLAVIARNLPTGAPVRSTPARTSGRFVRARPAATTRAGLAGIIIALAVALLFAWSRGSGTERTRGEPRVARGTPIQAAPPDVPGDSLYYSVQVAAYNTLPRALEEAARIEGSGRLAVVTPVRLGTQGVWYRVLVGAMATARAADSLLQDLWREQAVERPQGTILRTPDAYRLHADRDDVADLRARGVPAYIVPASNTTAHVYVGAFDLAEQAHTADSMLVSAHVTGTLVRRTGSPP